MERATTGVKIDFAARVALRYRIDIGELFAHAGDWAQPLAGRLPRRVAERKRVRLKRR